MNVHPITTPASPSLASPIFDASFDSIESLTTTFAAPAVPTIETTTVTEVALGYHRNQQYSITAMTTSTGAVAERYAYTAYGQPTILNASGTVLTSSAVGNRYTYTGREWDETLGLHHFRARWMSPLAGRFIGRDPIGYAGSAWNTYEYVYGKPLILGDPIGLIGSICGSPLPWGIYPVRYPVPPAGPPNGSTQDQCGRFVIVGSCTSHCGDPDLNSVPSVSVTLTVGKFSLTYLKGCEITCPGSPGQVGTGSFHAKAVGRLCVKMIYQDGWKLLDGPFVDCGATDVFDTRDCCAKTSAGVTGGSGVTGGPLTETEWIEWYIKQNQPIPVR